MALFCESILFQLNRKIDVMTFYNKNQISKQNILFVIFVTYCIGLINNSQVIELHLPIKAKYYQLFIKTNSNFLIAILKLWPKQFLKVLWKCDARPKKLFQCWKNQFSIFVFFNNKDLLFNVGQSFFFFQFPTPRNYVAELTLSPLVKYFPRFPIPCMD